MKLVLASNNQHKALEFGELLNQKYFTIAPSTKKISVDETGTSFYENAYLKAEKFYQELKQPVISDDSGLVVESLPGELGVKSARFGGENLTDRDRVKLLLEKMKKYPSLEKRRATFHCVLCVYLSPTENYFFEGKMDGVISHDIKGDHGFGYDPVFVPKEFIEDSELANSAKSFAEDPVFKAKNSHRAKACRLMEKFFQEKV